MLGKSSLPSPPLSNALRRSRSPFVHAVAIIVRNTAGSNPFAPPTLLAVLSGRRGLAAEGVVAMSGEPSKSGGVEKCGKTEGAPRGVTPKDAGPWEPSTTPDVDDVRSRDSEDAVLVMVIGSEEVGCEGNSNGAARALSVEDAAAAVSGGGAGGELDVDVGYAN